MNQIGVFIIIVLLFFFHVKAQEKLGSDPGFSHPPNKPSLAVVIGILSVMFSLTVLLLVYAKCCHTNPLHFLNRNSNHQDIHGLLRSWSRFSGINKTVIESLPVFRFSSLKGLKEGLECAVCLSKFEDAEVLRLLPKCKHAFHMNCIDRWLENHSSCPLCRYKVDVGDIKDFTFSNSLRFSRDPSNLSEVPNLEIFVQREQDHQGSSSSSSRFDNIGSSFRNVLDKSKKEELEVMHKFKHTIIISDLGIRNRWSDLNSSDMLVLNSKMLSDMSSRRLSPKEDKERKRLLYDESKFSIINRSHSVSCSSYPSTSINDEENSTRLLNHAEKRSMSEIIILPRSTELSIENRHNNYSVSGGNSSGREERTRRIWLQIARRTVEWFAGREKSSQKPEYKRQQLHV